MAEARASNKEPRVTRKKPLTIQTVSSILTRMYYKSRNYIEDYIWPTPSCYLRTIFFVVLVIVSFEPIQTERLNQWLWKWEYWMLLKHFEVRRWLKVPIISAVVSVMLFTKLAILRRYLMRILLSYQGWMYERKPTKKTLIWGLLVKLLSSPKPRTFNCQLSLPRQPVPPLKETMRKLMDSLEPLSSEKEMKELRKSGEEFINGIGWKLQIILHLKSWLFSNYITDWWNKYVYLMTRTPLPIYSNYMCMDQNHWIPTPIQAARAANFIQHYLRFKKNVERGDFPAMLIQGTIPICMEQFNKIFSTVRVPGETMDRMVQYKPSQSRHIVVVRKGIFYKVNVYDSKNQYLSSESLEKFFQWILEDAETHIAHHTDEEKEISSLTALDRTEWAKIRKQYFTTCPTNKNTLRLIESAICCVVFPDFAPKNITEKGRFLFHGDCRSIWFDKSVTYACFSDGQLGWHAEHSVADAPTMGYLWEYYLSREAAEKFYTEEGHCLPPMESYREAHVQWPEKMNWKMNPALVKEIRSATKKAKAEFADLDYESGEHTWGKGLMKTWKCSPDGCIQIALQLAYFKDAGKLALTYEASMTRLFLNARTETVRSCTKEAANFIRAMYDDNVPNSKKVELFRKACDRHQNLYRDAMCGKGIDRHLFALYVLTKAFGYECDFLKKVMSRPWTLSTSQQPQRQQQDKTTVHPCNCDYIKNKLSPGGGFGPTVKDGYGVSYMLTTDDLLYFHVTSRKSAKQTDSQRFLDQLFQSFDDIKNMFASQEVK